MRTDKQLYAVIAGFAGGIFVRSLLPFPPALSALAVIVGASLFALAFLSPKARNTFFLVSLCCVSAGLGALRYELKESHRADPLLASSLGRMVVAEGILIDEPALKAVSQQLVVALDTVNEQKAEANVLVQTERFPQFSYGDRVSIRGKLGEPESFETDTGRTFDYPAYLAKDDIHFQIRFADVEKIGGGEGNPVKALLFTIKHAFLAEIARAIPEPESSLAGGLLLGGKQTLDENLEEQFRIAGIIHIVVLSGYNITIVAKWVGWLFSFLPRRFGFSIAALSIILFALMTGASATIVRASIMALLVILAQATGRTSAVARGLFLAGFLMLLQNPMILVFDPSFQLSFLATVGLIYLSPLLEKYFLWVPEKFHLREVMLATLATQLAVLPLLLYQTGQLSLVGLPVNLLVLPLIPLTMFLAFLVGIAGFGSAALAMLVGFLAYVPLAYTIHLSGFFASLPFSAVAVPEINGGVLILAYAAFAAGLLVWMKKEKGAAEEAPVRT